MKRLGPAPLAPNESGVVDSWEERQRDDDLAQLLSSEWGRRIACWVILDLAGLHDPDAGRGRRSVGAAFLRRTLPVAPYGFADMARERTAESLDAVARVRGEQKKPEGETSE